MGRWKGATINALGKRSMSHHAAFEPNLITETGCNTKRSQGAKWRVTENTGVWGARGWRWWANIYITSITPSSEALSYFLVVNSGERKETLDVVRLSGAGSGGARLTQRCSTAALQTLGAAALCQLDGTTRNPWPSAWLMPEPATVLPPGSPAVQGARWRVGALGVRRGGKTPRDIHASCCTAACGS